MYPRSNCIPSTTSSSVSSDLASSTVITPSLPTFCIASAIMRPIFWSLLAEIVPIWAISSLVDTFFERFSISLTTASTAESMPRFRSIGLRPAATAFAPSWTIACASTVAVVVPSPARSLVFEATSRTIWAPIFSNLSASSISLATVTPSLLIRGAPKDLSSTTLRPFGPSVTLTVLANISTPRSIRSRVGVKANFFGSHGLLPSSAPFDDTHNVAFLHDDEFLPVDLDLGTGPFAKQHPIANLDIERVQATILAPGTGAGGEDLAFHRLLLGRIRNDDSPFGLLFLIDAADQHTVLKRSKLHDLPPKQRCRCYALSSTLVVRVLTKIWLSGGRVKRPRPLTLSQPGPHRNCRQLTEGCPATCFHRASPSCRPLGIGNRALSPRSSPGANLGCGDNLREPAPAAADPRAGALSGANRGCVCPRRR